MRDHTAVVLAFAFFASFAFCGSVTLNNVTHSNNFVEVNERGEAYVFKQKQSDIRTGYTKMNNVSKYLYEVFYDTYDETAATNYFASRDFKYITGGCSAVRNGNFFGRNMDWYYNESAEFVVHVSRDEASGRHASVGVSGNLPGITGNAASKRKFSELYALLPFYTLDGINDAGLFAELNVTHCYDDTWRGNGTYHMLMAVRHVLDYCSTAQEACQWIVDNVYLPAGGVGGYSFHWFIGDAEHTYLVEDGQYKDISERPYMTNFRIYEDSAFDPVTGHAVPAEINTLDKYGMGLERLDLIVDHYAECDTLEGMQEMMGRLNYVRSYQYETEPRWLTEFAGSRTNLTVLAAYDTPAVYDEIFATGNTYFSNRSRSADSPYYGTWHTEHSSVYDIENRVLYICPQLGVYPSVNEYRPFSIQGDFSLYNELLLKLKTSSHELHRDGSTNVIWQTVYSNGWVFLRAVAPLPEDGE